MVGFVFSGSSQRDIQSIKDQLERILTDYEADKFEEGYDLYLALCEFDADLNQAIFN